MKRLRSARLFKTNMILAFSRSLIIATALVVCLGSCEPTIANRGNILDPDKLAQVKVGTSTREEVATKLGTPTAVGTFDEKVWYYFGRQTSQVSFFDPDILKQEAVEVRFDDQGVVTSVTKLDPALAEDIVPAEGRTPTYGRDDTFFKQLFGSLAHPTLPDDKHGGGP